jgi:hypothetical protein
MPEPGRALWADGFHGERSADAPFAAHPDAEQSSGDQKLDGRVLRSPTRSQRRIAKDDGGQKWAVCRSKSAARPKMKAPIGRMASVSTTATATAGISVLNSAAMSRNTNTIRKKSKASSIQPR